MNRLGVSMKNLETPIKNLESPMDPVSRLTPIKVLILGLVATFVAFQLAFPFRHLLYPGDPSWTEEGHRFA